MKYSLESKGGTENTKNNCDNDTESDTASDTTVQSIYIASDQSDSEGKCESDGEDEICENPSNPPVPFDDMNLIEQLSLSAHKQDTIFENGIENCSVRRDDRAEDYETAFAIWTPPLSQLKTQVFDDNSSTKR